MQAREEEGSRALEFMGLTIGTDSPAAGGLKVTEVRPARCELRFRHSGLSCRHR
jgi:hypothetical protein